VDDHGTSGSPEREFAVFQCFFLSSLLTISHAWLQFLVVDGSLTVFIENVWVDFSVKEPKRAIKQFL
jgi:hypothetical protein